MLKRELNGLIGGMPRSPQAPLRFLRLPDEVINEGRRLIASSH